MSKIFNLFSLFNLPSLALGVRSYDIYVSPTGNDTTGDGSRLLPYATMTKANTVVLDGQSVWVEKGTYTRTNFLEIFRGSWYSNGATMNNSIARAFTLALGGTDVKYISGFIIDGTGCTQASVNLRASAANGTINNCNFINSTLYAINSVSTAGDNWVVNNSTLDSGTTALIVSYVDIEFNNCTFPNVRGDGFYRLTGTGNLTVNNCDITVLSGRMLYARAAGTYTFYNNTITTSGDISDLTYFYAGFAIDFNFTYNTFTSAHTSTDHLIYSLNYRVANIIINNNTITLTNGNFNKYAISVLYTTTCEINNNTIDCQANKAQIVGNIQAKANTAGATLSINDNTIYSRNEEGYNITAGTEGTSADDDKMIIEILRNTIYSAYYYDGTSTGFVHSIHVGFNKNFTIQDNNIYGAGYGLALEHGGDSTIGGAISGNTIIDALAAIRINGISDCIVQSNEIKSTKSYCSTLISVTIQTNPSLTTDINNNILYLGSGITIAYWIYFETNCVPKTIDYNQVYGVSETPNYRIEGTTYSTWAAIQVAGWEANGQNTNPY